MEHKYQNQLKVVKYQGACIWAKFTFRVYTNNYWLNKNSRCMYIGCISGPLIISYSQRLCARTCMSLGFQVIILCAYYVSGVAYKQLFPWNIKLYYYVYIQYLEVVCHAPKRILLVNFDITADPCITNIPPQINWTKNRSYCYSAHTYTKLL